LETSGQRLVHSRGLVVAALAREEARLLAESFLAPAGREQSMRRVLRKSIPFVQAVLIGTLAAAVIAGVAMLLPHS
jgi:hypothetical protein